MAKFILTASHDINRANGFHLDRGYQITITVPQIGIGPNNLFNNSRCRDTIIHQFQNNGIFIPPTDTGFYSRGSWDIKMTY